MWPIRGSPNSGGKRPGGSHDLLVKNGIELTQVLPNPKRYFRTLARWNTQGYNRVDAPLLHLEPECLLTIWVLPLPVPIPTRLNLGLMKKVESGT